MRRSAAIARPVGRGGVLFGSLSLIVGLASVVDVGAVVFCPGDEIGDCGREAVTEIGE